MLFEVRRCLLALVRGLALCALKLVELLLLVLTLASFALLALGFVIYPYLRCTDLGRRFAGLSRQLAGKWSGVLVASPYRAAPSEPRSNDEGLYRFGHVLLRSRWWVTQRLRLKALWEEQATWRDLLWLVLDPVVGTALAGLPSVLVIAGLTSPWLLRARALTGLAIGGGLLMAVVGIAVAPVLIDLHARWTQVLLAPVSGRSASRAGTTSRWTRRRLPALYRLPMLCGLSIFHFCVGVAVLATFAVTGIGGTVFVPAARKLTGLSRLLVNMWTGRDIPEPYLPEPPPPQPRPDGMYHYGRRLYPTPQIPIWRNRARSVMVDPSTWRDLGFLLVDPLAAVIVTGPLLAIAFGVGILAPNKGPWAATVLGILPGWASSAWFTFPAGYALAVAGFALLPAALQLYGRWAQWLLAPTAGARWSSQVQRLTVTRAEATHANTAELRRIERDLHDGAQARMVAVAMTLGTIEALIEKDPARAREMVAKAHEASLAAMTDLRHLVRGIAPPLLTERGLGDALRALALDCPQAVHVRVNLSGEFDPPIESAIYFGISELLANAGKHGDADEIWIDVRHADGLLRAMVVDDGRGGADPSRGSGLRGIERRLSVFDGELRLTSPMGGPTTAILEISCLPRTR